jgi:hypothetical protein
MSLSRLPLPALAILFGIATLSSPARGQEVLSDGVWLDGKLAEGDPVDAEGIAYDAFVLSGELSGVVEITVESGDFDTTLAWYATGGELTDQNDDFGGLASSTDSRLYVRAAGGEGSIRVSSFGGEGAGAYRIRARSVGSSTAGITPLEYGADINGALAETDSLKDGAFVDVYSFEGSRGDAVQIAVEGDFDTFLTLSFGGGGMLTTDDDGLGGTNSLIDLSLPRDGTYEVMVSAFQPSLGEYRLRVGTDMGIEPDPDAAVAGGMPANIQFTPEERAGLEERGGELVHELLGFSIPSPGADFLLTDEGDAMQGPNAQAWLFRDIMETSEFVVLAIKIPVQVQEEMLGMLMQQMTSGMGMEPSAERDLWAEARAREADLALPDDSSAQMRCTADGGDREIGLIVCALGQSSDGWSFADTLAGLRVR